MEEEQPLHRHKRQCSSVQENDRSGSGVDRTPVITEAVVEPTPDESTQMWRSEAETTVQEEPEQHRKAQPGRIKQSGNEEANRSDKLLGKEKET